MLTVERPEDMAAHIGAVLGPGEWVTVDQARIDRFAEATGDHHWMHVGVERAATEMPGGRTIAHGFLTLSMIPLLSEGMWTISQCGRGLNYGLDRVRFVTPLVVGSRIRARQKIAGVEATESAVRIRSDFTIEIEGESKPALVASMTVQVFRA